VFYPDFEPIKPFFSKKSNMNAACAPINNIMVGDKGLIQFQRQAQKIQKPQFEGEDEI
jgi:hypothetical protein